MADRVAIVTGSSKGVGRGTAHALASTGFTPRMVARLEPRVRAAAKDIVDQVAKKGSAEFVTSIAAELPLRVIADLLGVPQDDRHKLFEWSNRLIGFDDPEFQNTF